MISLGPVQDALNKLPLPSPDAAYLKQAAALASSGSMFQNPLNDSFSHIAAMNFDSHAATLARIPGAESLAAQCKAITPQASAIQSVSGQMFASTMPTNTPIPAALLANSNMNPADIAKVKDFSIPSVTQIMSTASAEQSMHAQLGTSGDNPCLPVQKAMEGTMKSAQTMTAITKSLSNGASALSSAISSLSSAADALAQATADEIVAAQAAFNQALQAANGVVSSAVNKVSGALSDMGNSLMDSMKTVRDSTEKSMAVATASMIKGHVQNNPCMKEVLSPGGNVIVFDTTYAIRNADAQTAEYLLNNDLVTIQTTLSSLGYETFKQESTATKISNTITERRINLTYTVDMDKWKKAAGGGDSTLNTITVTIKNPVTGESAWVKQQSIFEQLNTDNPVSQTATQSSVTIDVQNEPTWFVSKKIGLLSPAMQTMTEPPPATDADPIPSSVPVVVQTPSQVAAQVAKAEKAAIPPATVESPIVVQAADPVPATSEVVFTKSAYLRRERKKTDGVWMTVAKNKVEHLCGDAKLTSTFSNDGAAALVVQEYTMSVSSINALIAEYKRKNGDRPMYFQCDTVNFYKADGTLAAVQTIQLYFLYVEATNQVSITATQKQAGGGYINMLWDSAIFED